MRSRLQVPGSAAFTQEGAHLFRSPALFSFDIIIDLVCLMVCLLRFDDLLDTGTPHHDANSHALEDRRPGTGSSTPGRLRTATA